MQPPPRSRQCMRRRRRGLRSRAGCSRFAFRGPAADAAGRPPIACLPIRTPSADPTIPLTSPTRPASASRSRTICHFLAPMARSSEITGRRWEIAMLIALKIRNPATMREHDAADSIRVLMIETAPPVLRGTESRVGDDGPSADRLGDIGTDRSEIGVRRSDHQHRIDHADAIHQALKQRQRPDDEVAAVDPFRVGTRDHGRDRHLPVSQRQWSHRPHAPLRRRPRRCRASVTNGPI